jgi:hypothetical protein
VQSVLRAQCIQRMQVLGGCCLQKDGRSHDANL